ncbi:MAG: hypothetical protein FWG56_11630 [Desulfovibrionaceae bacterium]|jgi:tripartite-type tricarboxylate transporter receptor subunit TctC|nr:hypothetical protein [Desulfovibrionaceae bacterium]
MPSAHPIDSVDWLQRRGPLAACGLARAQLRNAPIRLLVGFSPGASSDAIGRALAAKRNGELGANIVVENRAGTGGQIAAIASAPDLVQYQKNGKLRFNPDLGKNHPRQRLSDSVN